jgi:hypothetical protein
MSIGVVIAVGLGAACSSDGRQSLSAGSPQQRGAASSTIAPATVVAPPPAFDEARARYEAVRAPAGKVVAHAPATTVDDVALRSSVRAHTRSGMRTVSIARRITISGGPFPYGDARVLVLVNGRSVGEGQVAHRGHALTVVVFDASLVHDGAVIGYQIGSRAPVTVGTLRTGA